jgi:hypothetical protein
MKLRLIALLLLAGGCASNTKSLPPADADDAIARIKAIMPEGWTVWKIDRDTYPFYRKAGKGTAVYLAPPERHQLKTEYEGVVFLMPRNYSDGGPHDPTRGQGQTSPPRYIGRNKKMRVYLWWAWPDAEGELVDVLKLTKLE